MLPCLLEDLFTVILDIIPLFNSYMICSAWSHLEAKTLLSNAGINLKADTTKALPHSLSLEHAELFHCHDPKAHLHTKTICHSSPMLISLSTGRYVILRYDGISHQLFLWQFGQLYEWVHTGPAFMLVQLAQVQHESMSWHALLFT